MADSLLYTTLHSTLSYIIPAQIFYPLAKFSNLCYQVILGVSNDPSSWSSTLLPPLIALVAGYIALLIAYRTLRSTIALIFWSIKWGIIIGVLLAGYSIYTGRADAIHSIGRVPWTRAISGVINQAPMLAAGAATPLMNTFNDQRRRGANNDLGDDNPLASLVGSIGLGDIWGEQTDQRPRDRTRTRSRTRTRTRSSTERSSLPIRNVLPSWLNVLLDEFNQQQDTTTTGNRPRTRSQTQAQRRRRRTRSETPFDMDFDHDSDSEGGEEQYPNRAEEDLRTFARFARRLFNGAQQAGQEM